MAEWDTRSVEVAVVFGLCGFDSHRAHGAAPSNFSRVGLCAVLPFRRVGRADDRGTLEKCRRATFRGFESHTRLVKASDVIRELDALIGRHGDGEVYIEAPGDLHSEVQKSVLIDHDRFEIGGPIAFVLRGDGTEV